MDNRQYRQIVDDYADMVYRIALNQTRRVPDAEDVVQAVFLKLYEKPPAWLCDKAERDSGRAMATEVERGAARDEHLRAWLIRVTVNECKSLWRSLWRQRVELRDIRDGDAPPFEEPAFAEASTDGADAGAATAATPTTIDICMVGDVLLHPSVYSSGRMADGSYDFSHLFANVSEPGSSEQGSY